MSTSHITVTDQFCGAGGSSQGVRRFAQRTGLGNGLEVRLALNHWKLAIETHNTNFPEAIHECTDIQACDPRRYPSTTILVTSPECFPAGTLVLCDRGLVPIERVQVGDYVLTHMNRFERVTSVASRKAPTMLVQGQGHQGLECTYEHPFYVRRQSRPWNNALRRGIRHIADPEWMEAAKLADQDVRWATPMDVPALGIPAVGGRGAQFNEAFWWMVGRWLADGVVTNKNTCREVIICSGRKKTEATSIHLNRCMPWRHRSMRTADAFTCSHNGLAEWLVQHFGKLAHGKTLPTWCLGMKVEWRQALLEGYLSGDGHVGPRRTQASTVSKSLAIGLRLLVTSLGYHATLGLYDQHCDTIEGRKVNTRPVYMITWENNRSQRTGWHDDRHAWSLVKAVKAGRASAEVYCLSVAKDESFVADGIVVHNCVNHSVAKGRKQVKAQLDAFDKGQSDPAAERSRATMWDVVRFAEHHKYKIVITENVVDARAWVLWDAWLMAMHNLGYQHQVVFYNSMFAWPTPQSRDRMYVVFWRKGQRRPDLDLRPWAPCPKCGPVQAIQKFKPKANVKAKYGTQYVYVCPRCAKQVMPFYYAAINAIDWTVPAERIGDRKKPLEERTLQRIAYGLKKYGNRPLSVSTLYGERLGCRVKDATESPLFGQHSANATAVATPFTVETSFGEFHAQRCRGADEPLSAQTGNRSKGVALPFILDSSFTKAKGEYMNGADEPIGTQTTTQSKGVVIPPALMVDTNYFTDHNKGLENPLPTQTGANKLGVAFLTKMRGTDASDVKGSASGLDEATGTITAGGPHHGLAFLAKLRGTDASHVKSTTSGLDEPVGTLSAGGLHHALISGKAMGYLQSYYGTGNQGALDEAMGALSTRDRHALVTGVVSAEKAPMEIEEEYDTGRWKKVRTYCDLYDGRGTWIEGYDPVRAKREVLLPNIEDLYFRMLKAHEVKAGMAFDPDYVVLGNQREQVKQLGNAVTPPVMELLIERCVESLM